MNKHYAVTDLHGMYPLWEQIKNYCDDNDVIYFLGDAADRGPSGMKIISEMLKDERVIYLKGNHEDMFVDGGFYLMDGDDAEYLESLTSGIRLWRINGGKQTIHDFSKLEKLSQRYYVKKINELPDLAYYQNVNGQNIILCHAGCQPTLTFEERSNYYWDRDHYLLSWPEGYDNTYVIHGHTPVPYMLKDFNQMFTENLTWDGNICNYAGGHKFNLDIASFATGRSALFNLDTLEVEQYFTMDMEAK